MVPFFALIIEIFFKRIILVQFRYSITGDTHYVFPLSVKKFALHLTLNDSNESFSIESSILPLRIVNLLLSVSNIYLSRPFYTIKYHFPNPLLL